MISAVKHQNADKMLQYHSMRAFWSSNHFEMCGNKIWNFCSNPKLSISNEFRKIIDKCSSIHHICSVNSYFNINSQICRMWFLVSMPFFFLICAIQFWNNNLIDVWWTYDFHVFFRCYNGKPNMWNCCCCIEYNIMLVVNGNH